MSGLASAWSDFKETFFPTVAYAEEDDAPEESPEKSEDGSEETAEQPEEDESNEEESKGDDEEEEEDDEDEDDDDDEEPADPLDILREKYTETVCKPFKHHFDECVERVTKAQEQPGYEDLEHKEDCIEEFFHLQHCLNDHISPVLFSKLK